MKIVAIGDFHVPSRAASIPNWELDVIKREKPNYILCTGDVESEDVLNELGSLAPVKCVRGNMDWLDLPEHEVIQCGKFGIGLIHGSRVHPRGDLKQLNWYAEKMGVNILIHGHTHKLDIDTYSGRLFINPGTATGSWGGATSGERETMVIIVINEERLTIRKCISGDCSGVVCYEWSGDHFVKCGEHSEEDM